VQAEGETDNTLYVKLLQMVHEKEFLLENFKRVMDSTLSVIGRCLQVIQSSRNG
jgi:hypothetical protein